MSRTRWKHSAVFCSWCTLCLRCHISTIFLVEEKMVFFQENSEAIAFAWSRCKVASCEWSHSVIMSQGRWQSSSANWIYNNPVQFPPTKSNLSDRRSYEISRAWFNWSATHQVELLTGCKHAANGGLKGNITYNNRDLIVIANKGRVSSRSPISWFYWPYPVVIEMLTS